MRVNQGFDFDMDLRFGVAMVTTGELRLASRDECRAWLDEVTKAPMDGLRGNVEKIKAEMADGFVEKS